LTPYLSDVIAKEGSITLERYMEIVLHHPEHGYYRQGNPLGVNGDFITSPDASPMFGEMIGVWCVEAWKRLGGPSPFILLELGPGQGTLMQAALQFTQHIPDFTQALKLYLFESNSTLRQIQVEKLSTFAPVHIDDLKNLPSLPTIVVANEFFDTQPLRQFVRARFGWRESLVTHKKGKLQFTSKHSMRLPKNMHVNPLAHKMRPGDVYEASAKACHYMDAIAKHTAHNGGAGLIIDYGYAVPPTQATLDALSRQQFVDVLASPGQVDVTAGVDFYTLANIAAQKGNLVSDLITQREFLDKMGLSSRADALRSIANDAQTTSINASLNHIASHSKMGKFKVLEFGKIS
jgi:NADH dehydrogenase [ubiquinone] 1 alpha subcomplex assembly factor 7